MGGFGANKVLHMNCLAGAQQRLIENGAGRVGGRLIVSRQMKPPCFNTLLPTRMHETEVVTNASSDKQSTTQSINRFDLIRIVIQVVIGLTGFAPRKIV